MGQKTANYLHLFPNSGYYYFRFRYPVKIARFLGKTYFCKSLSINDYQEASFVARFIRIRIFKDLKYYQMKDFELFLRKRFKEYKDVATQLISNGDFDSYHSRFNVLSSDEVNDFVNYIDSEINPSNIDDFKENHIAHKNEFDEYLARQDSVFEDAESHRPGFNELIANFSKIELKFKNQLMLFFQEQLKKHKEFEDISLTTPAELYNNISRGFTRSLDTYHNNLDEIEIYKSLRRDTEQKNKLLEAFDALEEQEGSEALPVKEYFEKFIFIKGKSVKENTKGSYISSFDYLYELIGEDFNLRHLNKNKAIEIQNRLLKKPVGSKKDTDETISNKTVNKFISHYYQFFDYLFKNQYLDNNSINPFSDMKLDESKKNSKTHRRQYTNDEVNKILRYEITSKAEAAKIRESAYWFPKVAFFTGMRLNEIAELTVQDLKKEGEIYYLDLFDKVLKNENSERRIPIHSRLIEYGFIEYVFDKKLSKSKYVFPDLRNRKMTKTIKKDGWGITASKWYNGNVFDKLGIEKNENGNVLDFHAIRTTILKNFKRNGLSGYLVKQLAGHLDKDDDVTFDDYGHGTNTKLVRLKEIIETINYED